MVESSLDAYRDIGGTTPGMGKVELSMERKSRANHDYRDIEGRVTPGAVTEETESRMPKPQEKVRPHGCGRYASMDGEGTITWK